MSGGKVASDNTQTFALVLEKPDKNQQAIPGTMLIKLGNNTVAALLPDSKDSAYFSALVLWCKFGSKESAAQYAHDSRLPDFVRKTIEGLTQ